MFALIEVRLIVFADLRCICLAALGTVDPVALWYSAARTADGPERAETILAPSGSHPATGRLSRS
jgi:hypothetical protein